MCVVEKVGEGLAPIKMGTVLAADWRKALAVLLHMHRESILVLVIERELSGLRGVERDPIAAVRARWPCESA